MGLLTEYQQKEMALAYRKRFGAVCDEILPSEGGVSGVPCGHLIPLGAPMIVTKWAKRTDNLVFLGAIPAQVRCVDCEARINGVRNTQEKYDKVRSAKSPITKQVKTEINPIIKRAIARLFKEDPKAALLTAEVIMRLRKRKSTRDFRKGEVSRTLAAMKKLRILGRKDQKWMARAK